MQRYKMTAGPRSGARKDNEGVWVLYEDAQAEIARLTAERDEARASLSAAPALWLEKAADELQRRLDKYVAENGIYDPETGQTEFPDGGEYESELVELIEAILALIPTDSAAALEKYRQDVSRELQVEMGWVFSDTNPEAQNVEDGENACQACGGSGHKDDADAALRTLRADAVREAVRICRSLGVLGGKTKNPYADWKIHADNLAEEIDALADRIEKGDA